MRVIFFIEPVIYRTNPDYLTPHLSWAHAVAASVKANGGVFAVASNQEICAVWSSQQEAAGLAHATFPLNSFDPLSPFGYRRDLYAAALYGNETADNPLIAALSDVRQRFLPDFVVMTSQNALARRAFAGLPILSIEQAPLPRMGQPHRVYFDPLGHQRGSLFETKAWQIKQLPLPEAHITDLLGIIEGLRTRLQRNPRYEAAAMAIEKIREAGRVALLVTQPPDWTAYDGALCKQIDVQGLLCIWEEQLPPDWIGVPTYHPEFRLNANVENALARSRSRLRFLPSELAQGLSELLLTMVDGMVTVSSTTSITGLLFRKRVIATGRCPFNGWVPRDVRQISATQPLSVNETASTLAFLTHRYTHLNDVVGTDPQVLAAVFTAAREFDPARWYLDVSEWSAAYARSLFNFD
jgi:hypothetical protein